MTEPERGPAAEPQIVVVGAACRDVAADDPRGWRLGGPVVYSALTTARLGLRTAALIGADEETAAAHELDLLRAAGVEVVIAPLGSGPVFENVETSHGRIQTCLQASDPVPVRALPAAWRPAAAWILAPVAAELAEDWAGAMTGGALVAVGWQGLLRDLEAGQRVRLDRPAPTPIVRRAGLVGVSRDDVDRAMTLDALCSCLSPGATLVLTQGRRGGLVMEAGVDGPTNLRQYPPVPAGRSLDPTGAGDSFLAALLAARAQPRLIGGRIDQGFDLLLAASVASLVLEHVGLPGVPERSAVRQRMAEGLAGQSGRGADADRGTDSGRGTDADSGRGADGGRDADAGRAADSAR